MFNEGNSRLLSLSLRLQTSRESLAIAVGTCKRRLPVLQREGKFLKAQSLGINFNHIVLVVLHIIMTHPSKSQTVVWLVIYKGAFVFHTCWYVVVE